MNFKLLFFSAISTFTISGINGNVGPFGQTTCIAEYTGILPQSYSLLPLKCFVKTKPGKCRAAIPSWNFSLVKGVGTCEQAQFGGCVDGCISFPTKEECEKSCHYAAFLVANPRPAPFEQEGCKVVSPTPFKSIYKDMPATCFIPTVSGTCGAKFKSFHYDLNLNKCVQAVFGGCEDGCQAFKTLESCQNSCKITRDLY